MPFYLIFSYEQIDFENLSNSALASVLASAKLLLVLTPASGAD
jgi:hypothetical protein